MTISAFMAAWLLAGMLGAGARTTAQNAPDTIAIDVRDDGFAMPSRIAAGRRAFHVEKGRNRMTCASCG